MKFLKKLFKDDNESEGRLRNEPEELIESFSPNGNADAFVEQDNSVVYLYLRRFSGSEESEVHSVWVRNLQNAPEELQVELMREGYGPMMPRANCVNTCAGKKLEKENLSLVWSEEGDAVALYENEIPIAIIPSWSGLDSFSGYSIECSEPHNLAFPLEYDNALISRFNNAKEYWGAWDNENYWESYQDDMIARITDSFGPHSKYFAIDNGEWPPRAMVLIEKEDYNQLVTLGISLRPQPSVESYFEEYEEHNRFEFAWTLSKEFSFEEIKQFGSYISGQATMPWNLNTWLGNGHTIGCDVVDGFNSVLLTHQMPSIKVKDLGCFRSSKINLLYLVPLTREELEFAMNNSSEQLLPQLSEKGIDHILKKGKR